MKSFIIAGLMALTAGAAFAQDKPVDATAGGSASSSSSSSTTGMCMAPVTPVQWSPAALPAKPALPSCVNPTTRVTTCSKTVLDRYNAAIENRNAAIQKRVDDVNAYIETLNHYNLAVTDYNNCEVHRLNGLLKAQ